MRQPRPFVRNAAEEVPSSRRRVRRPDVRVWTAVAALAVGTLTAAEFFIQVLVGTSPELWRGSALIGFMSRHSAATLAIVMVDTVLMAFLIVFLAGFRQLITRARSDLQWLADLVYGAGLAFVAVTMVGDSLEGGAAIDAASSHPNAIVLEALTEAHTLLFGATGCLLTALILSVAGYISRLSRLLPRWTGTLAYVVAGTNVIAATSVFIHPTNTLAFTAGGLAVTALATFPWLVWVVTVGVCLTRGGHNHPAAMPRSRRCPRSVANCAKRH